MREEMNELKEELKSSKDDQSFNMQVIKKLEENFAIDYESIHDISKSLESRITINPRLFIGFDAEIKHGVSSLVKIGCGIVTIVGWPGFGKSSIAIKFSRHLSNGIVVIFNDDT